MRENPHWAVAAALERDFGIVLQRFRLFGRAEPGYRVMLGFDDRPVSVVNAGDRPGDAARAGRLARDLESAGWRAEQTEATIRVYHQPP